MTPPLTRRNFLGSLVVVTAVAAVEPTALLQVAPPVSVPKPRREISYIHVLCRKSSVLRLSVLDGPYNLILNDGLPLVVGVSYRFRVPGHVSSVWIEGGEVNYTIHYHYLDDSSPLDLCDQNGEPLYSPNRRPNA